MTTRQRIGVLAPMVSELKPVVRAFSLKADRALGDDHYTGRAGDNEIVATLTGIGTKLAITATEQLLASHGVDLVIVVGIAGGLGSTVAVGDVIVPEVVIDEDSGAEYRPLAMGATHRGRLLTSDAFHVEPEILETLEAQGVIALDMETGVVAAVCERAGTPWSVVRSISDMANDHPLGDAVLSLAKSDGSANLAGVAKFMVTRPKDVKHLAKLARDSKVAANAAADTAFRLCANHAVS